MTRPWQCRTVCELDEAVAGQGSLADAFVASLRRRLAGRRGHLAAGFKCAVARAPGTYAQFDGRVAQPSCRVERSSPKGDQGRVSSPAYLPGSHGAAGLRHRRSGSARVQRWGEVEGKVPKRRKPLRDQTASASNPRLDRNLSGHCAADFNRRSGPARGQQWREVDRQRAEAEETAKAKQARGSTGRLTGRPKALARRGMQASHTDTHPRRSPTALVRRGSQDCELGA